MTTMTKDEFVANVATLVAGLQVPVSIAGKGAALGVGAQAWTNLITLANHGFGWTNAVKLQAEFRNVLGLDAPQFTEDEAAALNAEAGLDDHGDPLPG